MLLIVVLAGQAQAARFKIATLSPEGSIWMEKMRDGAEELARRTDNRVRIKYYPGGVMGDDKAVPLSAEVCPSFIATIKFTACRCFSDLSRKSIMSVNTWTSGLWTVLKKADL